MNINIKAIIGGAISGFGLAFYHDIHLWQTWPAGTPFDWKKAVTKWLTGAVSGAMTAAGIAGAAGA